MEIKRIQVEYIYSSKLKGYDFSNTNLLYSEKNSTGKTTFLRAVLFALGYNIPSTENLDFNDYRFKLEIENNNVHYTIEREGNTLILNNKVYSLPCDEMTVHSILYSTENKELLSNIIGATYFDQEKGWTLLNRGTVIGGNKFSVESFFRGLNSGYDENVTYDLHNKLDALEQKISRYKFMKAISAFKNKNGETSDIKSAEYFHSKNQELLLQSQKLGVVKKKLENINKIVFQNSSFIEYLTQHKIYIKNPNQPNELISVNKNSIAGFEENKDLNEYYKRQLLKEKNLIENKIKRIKDELSQQDELNNAQPSDELLIAQVKEVMTLSDDTLKKVINDLTRQRDELRKQLQEKTIKRNDWFDKGNKYLKEYIKELGLNVKNSSLLSKKLKGKTGALYYQQVFIFKLIYIRLLNEKLGYTLPIFIDSPFGREVEIETVKKMLNILHRDLPQNQIIYASVHSENEFPKQLKVIPFNHTFFDFPTEIEMC